MKREAAFWGAVGITAIVSVLIFKLAGAQPWAPASLQRLSASI